ncbi:hypothetical protein ACRWXJ_24025, partial [Escherichia coli]
FDVFAGKKSAQIREILINESAWEEMTCLFAPSLAVSLEIGAAVKDFSVSRKLLLLQGSNHRRVVPFVL